MCTEFHREITKSEKQKLKAESGAISQY